MNCLKERASDVVRGMAAQRVVVLVHPRRHRWRQRVVVRLGEPIAHDAKDASRLMAWQSIRISGLAGQRARTLVGLPAKRLSMNSHEIQ